MRVRRTAAPTRNNRSIKSLFISHLVVFELRFGESHRLVAHNFAGRGGLHVVLEGTCTGAARTDEKIIMHPRRSLQPKEQNIYNNLLEILLSVVRKYRTDTSV